MGVGVGVEEERRKVIFTPYPHPSPYFCAPWRKLLFSPQPIAAIKIKDGGHSCR